MVDIKKIEEALNDISEGEIILLEINPDNSSETTLASLEYLVNKNDTGIVVSASRPYANLLNMYKKNNIDINKIYILDLISKSQAAEVEAENAMFLDNVSSLTSISLAINECIKKIPGKKFIFIDSITSMLIHNDQNVFARFIHSLLTRMRINGVDGVLVSFQGRINDEIRAEIAQLCDRVIKI